MPTSDTTWVDTQILFTLLMYSLYLIKFNGLEYSIIHFI